MSRWVGLKYYRMSIRSPNISVCHDKSSQTDLTD